MSNLNWTRQENGNYVDSTGNFEIEKRKDGYFDVYLALAEPADELTKLNKSRLRLGPAKQLAEDHYLDSMIQKDAEGSDPTSIPSASGSETTTEVENRPDPQMNTGSTGDDGKCEKESSSKSFGNAPSAGGADSSGTMCHSVSDASNWAFLGAILSVVFVKALADGKGLKGAAGEVYRACRTKGERRKVRQLFRQHNYGNLSGLAI